MALDFCNVLIVSGLTKPPKIGVFSANGPVADFQAHFQHVYCPLSWQSKTIGVVARQSAYSERKENNKMIQVRETWAREYR